MPTYTSKHFEEGKTLESYFSLTFFILNYSYYFEEPLIILHEALFPVENINNTSKDDYSKNVQCSVLCAVFRYGYAPISRHILPIYLLSVG